MERDNDPHEDERHHENCRWADLKPVSTGSEEQTSACRCTTFRGSFSLSHLHVYVPKIFVVWRTICSEDSGNFVFPRQRMSDYEDGMTFENHV
jgi:hypothetical protein